jgi:Outer membrane protein beta-barrel domain
MNEDLHNIDDLFRKALEENQELPAHSVWDAIDKTLYKKKVVSISKKYNKLKWAAAALLLFSIGMAMYTLHIRKQNRELVKQNKEGRNIIKQNSQNKIDAVDSLSTGKIKILPSEDYSTINEIQKQKKIAGSSAMNDKIKITDKTSLVNKVAEKKSLTGANPDTTFATRNATESVALQNQKKSIFKNTSGIKIGVESGGVGSGNATKRYNAKFEETSTGKNIIANNEEKNNLNNFIITDKEKNIEGNEIVPDLKYDFLISTQKPDIQIDKKIQAQSIALKYNKHSFSKKKTINSYNNSLFSATVFFSPDIVSTELKNDHPRFMEEERSEIEKNERIKFSSTFGILLDYTIGKKWKIESGISYSYRKTDIHPKTIYARPDNNGNINYRFNCSAGYSYVSVKSSTPPVSGDSVSALASTNNLQYIGLPLYAKYIFTTGRFSILPGAGVSFNFLTKGKIETTIATPTGSKNPSSDKIQGLKSVYLNGDASIGVQYKLNKTLALYFEPAFRFALSSINKDASVKTNLNSIGLSTGLVFKF